LTSSFRQEHVFDEINADWLKHSIENDALKLLNSVSKIISFERQVQGSLREKAIEQGVFLQNPETIQLSHDTYFGAGVVIEANVYLSQNVIIGDNVRIRAFSHLEDVIVQNNVQIGPFARVRGGSVIGEGVKLGNFVEVKKSILGKSTKASHLAYIGDAKVGKNVNFGAGSVICNYDGFTKHETTIMDNTFIGSNSTIISPRIIGSDSFVAAASCINYDMEDGTFAISRSAQVNKSNIKIKK
jgi:bifunctional UDP-N-acetylglucosamine pyrophosphorylase/glucosamine-1-phosphate N-acetyltransferase